MDARYRTLLLVLGVLIATIATAATSSAQYLSYQADQLGVPVDRGERGIRLLSMGSLRFVVPDENNEINLADFGRNLAGTATDKDGWSVESWFSRFRRTDDAPIVIGGSAAVGRDAYTTEGATTRVIYRNGNGRAIGGSYNWTAHKREVRFGDRSRIRGPQLDLFWNETFGDLSLALGGHQITDEETLTSNDVFAVHHVSSVLGWTASAAYPFFGFEWGAQFGLDRVLIEGKSIDAAGFHEDDFEWLRPTRKLRLSAFLPEGGDLEFGANFSSFSLDGAEDGEISWSEGFPQNPGGFDFDRIVPTFEEEESGTRIEARALYWLGWAPRVAAFAARETRSSDVVEAANFVGSRRQGSSDRTRNEIGGGFGTSLFAEKVTVAVEGLGIFTTDDTVDREGVQKEIKSRDVSGRIGIEWFTRPDFALRGGYERLVIDSSTEEPFTLQTAQGATIGFGWVPRGAIYVLDGVFRYVDGTPDEDGGEERDSFELAVYGRLLF